LFSGLGCVGFVGEAEVLKVLAHEIEIVG
jgi:hypothetical protein